MDLLRSNQGVEGPEVLIRILAIKLHLRGGGEIGRVVVDLRQPGMVHKGDPSRVKDVLASSMELPWPSCHGAM